MISRYLHPTAIQTVDNELTVWQRTRLIVAVDGGLATKDVIMVCNDNHWVCISSQVSIQQEHPRHSSETYHTRSYSNAYHRHMRMYHLSVIAEQDQCLLDNRTFFTYSAIARELVKPGDSMPYKHTRPSTPWPFLS